MAFELPPLPYPKNALEPYTSARTLEFHHGKHHQAYVTTLNELVEGSPLERKSLEEIVKATYKDESKTKVFNNAAQVWNHNFFWNCLKPQGGGAPKGDLAQAIERDLGGWHKFEEDFKKAAIEQLRGVFAIGHAESLGTREPGERDLARRRLPGPRMRFFPAEMPPAGPPVERRAAIVTDAKSGKSRAAVCRRHDRPPPLCP